MILNGLPWKQTDHSVVFEIASKRCISDSFFDHDVQGSASAGSRRYPQDERHWQEREKTSETSLDRAKSARERERERVIYQRGGAESGKVWQCFIFYHSFYTLS